MPLQVVKVPWSVQSRPGQQGVVCEHCCPAEGQVLPGWQVPLDWPTGMSQERPVQQSALAVQAPFWGWQDCGAEHWPLVQTVEQHCGPVVQVAPLARQGAWQKPPTQLVEQHSVPVVQLWPSALQVVGFWQVLLAAQWPVQHCAAVPAVQAPPLAVQVGGVWQVPPEQ